MQRQRTFYLILRNSCNPFLFISNIELINMYVATSRTDKRLIRPFDFRQVLQALLVAFESVIELNGIHTFEYFYLYHATKVAINIGLSALSAYTYKLINYVG